MASVVEVVKRAVRDFRRSPVTLRAVPDWLTVNEAAAYLKVERSTIYRYCELGLLPFFELKTGGGRRFKREDLDALLEPGGKQTDGSDKT